MQTLFRAYGFKVELKLINGKATLRIKSLELK